MKKVLLTILGTAFAFALFTAPTKAEALTIKVEPSVVFGQFFSRVEERPVRVVHQYQDVYGYQEPYIIEDYYYQRPVVRREYVRSRPVIQQRYVRSTNVNLGIQLR